MRRIISAAVIAASLLPGASFAGSGYHFTGHQGIMHLASVDPAQKDNEDIYRFAVADACAGKNVCQVLFWVGLAPKALPMTDAQVDAQLVHWQQNLNTGLRRWLVKCSSGTKLFANERQCM